MIPKTKTKDSKIIKLPKAKRPPPAKRIKNKKQTNISIPGLELTSREWMRLLTLMCDNIQEDTFDSLEVARKVALIIDEHFQNTEEFKKEINEVKKCAGSHMQDIIEKFNLPPWER